MLLLLLMLSILLLFKFNDLVLEVLCCHYHTGAPGALDDSYCYCCCCFCSNIIVIVIVSGAPDNSGRPPPALERPVELRHHAPVRGRHRYLIRISDQRYIHFNFFITRLSPTCSNWSGQRMRMCRRLQPIACKTSGNLLLPAKSSATSTSRPRVQSYTGQSVKVGTKCIGGPTITSWPHTVAHQRHLQMKSTFSVAGLFMFSTVCSE